MMNGSNFGEALMKKYGWTEGKGLGREESGMSEALKVKLKFDHAGLGLDKSKQFTNHWWDHAFNKAAANIVVNTCESGEISLKHKKKKKKKDKSSRKCPSVLQSNELYSGFIKGSTLQGSEEIKCEHSDSDSDVDLSMKLSDDQLFQICGGQTAHKGARHGLTMSAKLARIKKQDEIYMNKISDKKEDLSSSIIDYNNLSVADVDTSERKKKKKTKHKKIEMENNDENSENTLTPKKSKRKRKNSEIENPKDINDNIHSDDTIEVPKTKKKKSKHKKKSK